MSHQKKSSLDDLLVELNQLVGLEKVKKEVNRLIIYQKIQSKRKEVWLKIFLKELYTWLSWEIQEQEKQLSLG